MKKISVITPCLNAEKYIQETMESVFNQTAIRTGRVQLEYFIMDGKSTDNTLKIIYELINKRENQNNSTIIVDSETDKGMYDALARGLKSVSGDVCAYINAGDYYSIHAFDIVLDVFEKNSCKWITGLNVVYNDNSQLVWAGLPFKYRRIFFACGFYGKILPFVQQESTFWRSHLNKGLDLKKLAEMKYAGDYYIWRQFSEKETLNIIGAYLGGFRRHKGQISEDARAYFSELKTLILTKPTVINYMLALFDKFLWQCPPKVKKIFNRSEILLYDHGKRDWV